MCPENPLHVNRRILYHHPPVDLLISSQRYSPPDGFPGAVSSWRVPKFWGHDTHLPRVLHDRSLSFSAPGAPVTRHCRG